MPTLPFMTSFNKLMTNIQKIKALKEDNLSLAT